MKRNFIVVFILTVVLATNAIAFGTLDGWAVPSIAETRCGWFVNPTPANAWLVDKHGTWMISSQGADSNAEGEWPSFGPKQWIETNGSYGHGCACLNVNVDKDEMRILEILSATAKPLSACRKDKALKGKEPKD